MDDLEELEVENVYVYVGDAVRWGALPNQITNNGTRVKTIAAGIHTPTSFASIVSGVNLPQHQIEDFSTHLSDESPNFLTIDVVTTAFANTIVEKFNPNPHCESVINRTLNTTIQSFNVIGEIEPPFIFLERGPGGHSPYGGFDGNAWEYFRSRKSATVSTFKKEYRSSIDADIKHFESQVQKLADRGILDETLIIYTSDHGELLGENGCLGHNAPIHPKLVYVPTVFQHPSLKTCILSDRVLRHIDIHPTIRGLLGLPKIDLPGRDLTDESLTTIGSCHHSKQYLPVNLPGVSGSLEYDSVWDSGGGYVHPKTNGPGRMGVILGKLLKSPKREFMRRHLLKTMSFYLAGSRRYGDPSMSREEADTYLEWVSNLAPISSSRSELSEEAENRLHELGYLT